MKRTILLAAVVVITATTLATPAWAMRDPGPGPMFTSGMELYQYGAFAPSCAPAPAYMPAGPSRTGMSLYGYGARRLAISLGTPAHRDTMMTSRIGQNGLNNQYADGINLYQYVGSNPTEFVDPSGLFRKYTCCNQNQINTIKQDEARALQQIQALRGQINAAIAADTGQYPAFTALALQTSLRYLDTAADAIRNKDVKCELPGASSMCKNGAGAWQKWIFGQTVHLCPVYFGGTRDWRAATLVHEGTHFGGTLDVTYFAKSPHRVGLTGWQDIASTYDTWILRGFCIPGHDCP